MGNYKADAEVSESCKGHRVLWWGIPAKPHPPKIDAFILYIVWLKHYKKPIKNIFYNVLKNTTFSTFSASSGSSNYC